MTIATANSGSSGESGNMTVSTGSTTSGVSGGIAVSTGDSSDTSGGSAFSQATLPVGPRAISASRPATRLMARGVRSPLLLEQATLARAGLLLFPQVMHPKSLLAVRALPLVVNFPCQLAMELVLEVHFTHFRWYWYNTARRLD